MDKARNLSEMKRLVGSFECEAAKFHDIEFHTWLATPEALSEQRKFHVKNYTIKLWDFIGAIGSEGSVEKLGLDIQYSHPKWGVVNAEHSYFGTIEGDSCDLFVRMAKRAGSLLDVEDVVGIHQGLMNDLMQNASRQCPIDTKPVMCVNSNPLAKWLNYLLYHLSFVGPMCAKLGRIEPDLFALSLRALERRIEEDVVTKVDRSSRNLPDIQFKVSVSFPGEQRSYVSQVVNVLRNTLGSDAVFYDYDYQSQLARPNIDVVLQKVYRNQSKLVVVFLCAKYAQKQWCGLEWRAIRDLIKHKQDEQIMFVRFDDVEVDGLLSIDGYVDANEHDPHRVAEMIIERVSILS